MNVLQLSHWTLIDAEQYRMAQMARWAWPVQVDTLY